jgi:hypothetical protein
VEGVRVKVSGHYFTTYSDPQGFFRFNHLPAGTYDIEFTAFGHHPLTMEAQVIGGQTTQAGATLTPIPAFTVSGQVTGNDGLHPAGAAISLSGYADYSALTAEDGSFSIDNVFEGTYALSVTAEGYDTHEQGALPVEAPVHLEITLTETLGAPIRLDVNIDDHPNGQALFSWDQAGLVKLSQHDGTGSPNAFFQTNQRVYGTVFNLENYPDAVISYIDFHHMQWGQPDNIYPYTVYVVNWQTFEILGSTGTLNTTVVDGWEEMVGMGSLEVGGLQQVAILIHPQGHTSSDAYPCITGDSNGPSGLSLTAPLSNLQDYTLNGPAMGDFLINLWITTAETGKELIQAAGLTAAPALPQPTRKGMDAPSSHATLSQQVEKSNPGHKSPRTYHVFLDGLMVEENYTHNTLMFDDLSEGSYTAGVQRVYTTGLSEIVTIDFDMVYDVSGQLAITTNSGLQGAGAEVILRNMEVPRFVYAGTADEQGVLPFENVRKGSYSLRITLDGFHVYEQQHLAIDQEDFSLEAELEEVIIAPTRLHVRTRDMEPGTALFSWNNDFEPAFRGQL